MRRPRFLLALLATLALGCQPAENAVLIDVHTQADVETLRIVVLALDSDQPPAEEVRRIARSADDINAAPLRIAVDLLGPAYVLVHLDGTTPDGERIVATRCYGVQGVLRDSVMLFGPLGPLDLDGDGFAEDSLTTCREPSEDGRSATSCDLDPYVCPDERGADCDSADATRYPGAPSICLDGIDQDCDGSDEQCEDDDQDGWDTCPESPTGPCDCNDGNPAIFPGAMELCPADGIDQDCDGMLDVCCDLDGDGSQRCPDGTGDCDDEDAERSPAFEEICDDGIDNNCNEVQNESAECLTDDLDGDGAVGCDVVAPGAPCDANDCDASIHPGAEELCGPRIVMGVPGNGVDEDQDAMIDEGCTAGDVDGDGVEPPRDCDDTSALFTPSAAYDDCEDMRSNNCVPGEDASCSMDSDGDGYVEPPGCEGDASITPGNAEGCNGRDDDCDGFADERLPGCAGGVATDFATAFLHCGGCRQFCPENAANECVGGMCDCNTVPGIGVCTDGERPGCCGDGCVDLNNDERHCGGCNLPCGQGETCSGGQCTCGGTAAASGSACPEDAGHVGPDDNVCCNDTTCIDVRASDPNNCGECGRECGVNALCNGGLCQCVAPTGTTDFEDCNRDLNVVMMPNGCEVDILGDDEGNCGACGRLCAPQNAVASCTDGTCGFGSCLPGFADCNIADGCETSTTTVLNCGGCGVTCDSTRADGCNGTSCRCGAGAACGASDRCCGGTCVPRTSTSACGGCGIVCDAVRSDSCDGTNCRCGGGLQCGAGQRCCGGTCVALTSTSNCGGCGITCDAQIADGCDGSSCTCGGGRACGASERCCGGTCVPRTSTAHCGGCSMACNAVTTDACNGTSCQCGAGAPCAAGQRCCGGVCVALTSSSHCGACGNACDPVVSDSCNGTSCQCGTGPACAMTQRCCGGSCVPRTSTANCGGCGIACDPVVADNCNGTGCRCGTSPACGATQRCCGGTCVARTSTNHCGGCGIMCSVEADSCNGTACRCGAGAACPSGQGCCGGTCTDLDTTMNCGGCGVMCGSNETCSSGSCMCGTNPACSGALPVCCDPPGPGGLMCVADLGAC